MCASLRGVLCMLKVSDSHNVLRGVLADLGNREAG